MTNPAFRFPNGRPVIGMPDPSKYPDWKPDRKAPGPTPEPKPIPINDEFICGGPDSPCFINGEVMTRREAIKRGLITHVKLDGTPA